MGQIMLIKTAACLDYNVIAIGSVTRTYITVVVNMGVCISIILSVINH